MRNLKHIEYKPTSDKKLALRLSERQKKTRKDCDALGFTIMLLKMWAVAKLKKFKEMSSELLEQSRQMALNEWGTGTEIIVDEDLSFVLIENFDGRSALFSFADLERQDFKLEQHHLRIISDTPQDVL